MGLSGLTLALESLRRFSRRGSRSRHNGTRQKQGQGLPKQTLVNVSELARHTDLSWATFRTGLSDTTCAIAASENRQQHGKYDPQDGDPSDSEVCDDG